MVYGWFNSMEPLKKPMHILVLGFDSNNKKRPGRTDAMMVVEVNPKKGIGIISVPRDLWVELPTVLHVKGKSIYPKDSEADTTSETDKNGTDFKADSDSEDQLEMVRINTVYRLGNRNFGKGMGIVALKEVLEQELDLKVDYTMAINYAGLNEVLNILGGVEVDVQCPIKDNFINAEMPGGYEPLYVPAGKTHLTSRQALLFMRSRHGRSDMDRSRRQQLVLMGLRKELLSEKNFFQLPRLFSKMMAYVSMDMEMSTVLRVTLTVKDLRGNLHGMVLRPPMVEKLKTSDGKSVLVLNTEKYEKEKRQLFKSALPGTKIRNTCPGEDVALNWKDAKKKAKEADTEE
ncbi:MAG: LCP family protein [Deltaproteobacteria bacterium]|nr:LCP family protein [Deltaproteobacteria bacterium]